MGLVESSGYPFSAKLSHPNIVQIYNAGTEGQWRFTEMEKINGPNLAEYVRQNGPLSEEEAVTIGKALASAVMGTPGYMSPEQYDAVHVDHRADIYALGEILYFILTGANPFDGATVEEVMAKHAQGEHAPLGNRRPAIDPRLAAIVEKMMSANPANRHPSAEAVVEELEALRQERVETVALPKRRRPWGAVAVVVGTLLAASGLWWRLTSSPLRVEVEVMAQTKDGAGRIREFPVEEETALRSGDNFRVTVTPDGKGYVYVLHCASDGTTSRLFPQSATAGTASATGIEVAMPSDSEWYRLDNVPGMETVCVLASRKPLAGLEGLLKEMAELGQADRTRGIEGIVPDMNAQKERIGRITEIVRKACPGAKVVSFKHEAKR